MEKFKLQLEQREGHLKPNQLRRDGKIPATIYGAGIPSESVQVNAREFSRLPSAAFSHILELESGKGNISAIIRHIQRKATTHEVLNIEFYRVQADRKLTVVVPLKFVGESPAVKLGGQLVESYQEAEVECLPSAIPDFLEVNMANIKEVEHGIHFSELELPEGVQILNPPDEIIVRVVAPRAVAEDKPAAAAAAPAAS
jgi:large subunit ribosomal protein L25